jgi:hypothetical protein
VFSGDMDLSPENPMPVMDFLVVGK